MKLRLAALAAAGLLGALGVVAPGTAANKNGGTGEKACGDNGEITWTPTALWPPNHKAQPITFTYTDEDGGDVTLTIISNLHNETVNGEEINGTGNTPVATDSTGAGPASDDDGSVSVTGSAVSERSGHKNASGGRVYEFDYTADSNTGEDGCSSSIATAGDGLRVFVPHDMGKRANG